MQEECACKRKKAVSVQFSLSKPKKDLYFSLQYEIGNKEVTQFLGGKEKVENRWDIM